MSIGTAEYVGIVPPTALATGAETLQHAGQTVVWVAREQRLLGFIALARDGVTPTILSGDAPPTVEAIARELKVDHARARLTPDAKADCIAGWQRSGLRVGMVGDGVNDAPALAAPLRPLEMCAKRQ